jgi:predicted transcriptional regulator of viral defense system
LHSKGVLGMSEKRSALLPATLARTPLRTIRAKDAEGIYAHPGPELSRLAKRGLLHRVANGYYVVVPQEMVNRYWVPDLEATAAGIASAIYGSENAILMGISAARVHGAIPRGLGSAVVAVPQQHRPISLKDRSAVVHFVKRATETLDAERVSTPLGPALATSPEQTILDLAHRPQLGNAEAEISEAVAILYGRSDKQRLEAIARRQRLLAPLRRAETLAAPRHG